MLLFIFSENWKDYNRDMRVVKGTRKRRKRRQMTKRNTRGNTTHQMMTQAQEVTRKLRGRGQERAESINIMTPAVVTPNRRGNHHVKAKSINIRTQAATQMMITKGRDGKEDTKMKEMRVRKPKR